VTPCTSWQASGRADVSRVPESAPEDTFVAHVVVSDPDEGRNGRFDCTRGGGKQLPVDDGRRRRVPAADGGHVGSRARRRRIPAVGHLRGRRTAAAHVVRSTACTGENHLSRCTGAIYLVIIVQVGFTDSGLIGNRFCTLRRNF